MLDRQNVYRRGIDLFNGGEFWEAHEAWEGIWREDSGPERVFYQGLIQVAAAFHHFRKGNPRGMRAKLTAGIEKLQPFKPFHEGIDLDRFLASVDPWRDTLERAPDELPTGLETPRIDLEQRESHR